MHPAVKALIAWSVAGYAAGFAQDLIRHAMFGALGDVFVFPGIVRTLFVCATHVPLSTAYCLIIFVLAVPVRMGLRRFSLGTMILNAVSFLAATLAGAGLALGIWYLGRLNGDILNLDNDLPAMIAPTIIEAIPFGLAAFGVYWTVYRDRPQPDMTRVF